MGTAFINETDVVEATTNVIFSMVIPFELIIGIICQILNLFILSRRSMVFIKGYTDYSRALSTTYLIIAPLMLLSVLRKQKLVNMSKAYVLVWYSAYCEQYIINVSLVAANLIIVLIAGEAAYTLINPLSTAQRPRHRTLQCLIAIYAASMISLSPLLLRKYISGVNEDGEYQIKTRQSDIIAIFLRVLSSCMELWMLVIIFIVYGVTFRRFQQITAANSQLRRNTRAVRNARKAIVSCSAPVLAYVISNAPSAVKELLYLWQHSVGSVYLNQIFSSKYGHLIRAIVNACLVFNFTLFVGLQYFGRQQYRQSFQHEMHKHKIFSRPTHTHTGLSPSMKCSRARATTEPRLSDEDALSMTRRSLRPNRHASERHSHEPGLDTACGLTSSDEKVAVTLVPRSSSMNNTAVNYDEGDNLQTIVNTLIITNEHQEITVL